MKNKTILETAKNLEEKIKFPVNDKEIYEENDSFRFARTILFKAYAQETKKDFMNLKGLLNSYIYAYISTDLPVDFGKLAEIFELTKDEEEILKKDFQSYPNLNNKDTKLLHEKINNRLELYRYKLREIK